MSRPIPIQALLRARKRLPGLLTMARRGELPVRGILMLGGIIGTVLVSGWLWLAGGRYVSVDDAYVRAPKLMVTTDVSGIVERVEVNEGQRVRKGDILFRLRSRPFEIALQNARAQLSQSALQIKAMKLDHRRLMSAIAAQQAQVDLATANHRRLEQLITNKTVSQAIYDQARFALLAAQRTLDALRQEALVQLAKLGGDIDVAVESHPQYLQSKSLVDEAQRQLDQSVVRAPFDGVVTKVESLQPGVFLVAPTAALTNTGAVALVANHDVWVEANVKETDLTHVRPGNAVSVTIDTYPGKTWKGRVETISPASGAEFSILPSQNASGNWVKITQRVPVRILVETGDGDPALRAGMSAVVSIDTRHRRSLADLLFPVRPR
ncbi:MAG: HlyD family secretion protein [Hyphomicrobiaceae bacterium]